MNAPNFIIICNFISKFELNVSRSLTEKDVSCHGCNTCNYFFQNSVDQLHVVPTTVLIDCGKLHTTVIFSGQS